MNLISRFVRYLVLSIFHVLVAVITAIFHYVLAALSVIFRFVLWPFLIATLRVLLGFFFLSFAATLTGPIQYTDRLASDWTQRLLEMGAPRERIGFLYVFCQLIIGSLVAIGWVVSVLFTMEILRVVFGFFI